MVTTLYAIVTETCYRLDASLDWLPVVREHFHSRTNSARHSYEKTFYLRPESPWFALFLPFLIQSRAFFTVHVDDSIKKFLQTTFASLVTFSVKYSQNSTCACVHAPLLTFTRRPFKDSVIVSRTIIKHERLEISFARSSCAINVFYVLQPVVIFSNPSFSDYQTNGLPNRYKRFPIIDYEPLSTTCLSIKIKTFFFYI